jgi:hypothetical protein
MSVHVCIFVCMGACYRLIQNDHVTCNRNTTWCRHAVFPRYIIQIWDGCLWVSIFRRGGLTSRAAVPVYIFLPTNSSSIYRFGNASTMMVFRFPNRPVLGIQPRGPVTLNARMTTHVKTSSFQSLLWSVFWQFYITTISVLHHYLSWMQLRKNRFRNTRDFRHWNECILHGILASSLLYT